MKKLNWLHKFIFLLNLLVGIFLLLAYIVPYFSPIKFPKLSIFSLITPILIIANIGFAIYWIIRLKKQFLLSTIILLAGFKYFGALYQISEKKILLIDDMKVMSYNVRLFNIYKWKKEGKVETLKAVKKFIQEKKPDVLCFQEFLTAYDVNFDYPYKFVNNNPNKERSYFGQAIFSNYKIINSGSLNFNSVANNGIFVDLIKNKDTLRVYNLHLESQKIQLDKENFGEKNSDKLLKRIQTTFQKQAEQAKLLIAHEKNCNYKTIITGDFNNTAFSYTYNKIKGNKKDAFIEAGKGFGKTYDYIFPSRIDYILTDKSLEINNFKSFNFKYSDHFPIMARINFK